MIFLFIIFHLLMINLILQVAQSFFFRNTYSKNTTNKDSLFLGLQVMEECHWIIERVFLLRKISAQGFTSYSRCPSFPNGLYYAAWEVQDDLFSKSGHIYTSHSYPISIVNSLHLNVWIVLIFL